MSSKGQAPIAGGLPTLIEEGGICGDEVEVDAVAGGFIEDPAGFTHDSAAASSLHIQLIRFRSRASAVTPPAEASERDQDAHAEIAKLRNVYVRGLGQVPVSCFVDVMQSDSVSPAVRDAAFEAVFYHYRTPLSRFLGNTTLKGNPDLVPDTVQISLTKVYTKIDKYEPEPHQDAFTGWVWTIAKRSSIDMLRANKRQIPFSALHREGQALLADEIVPLTSCLHVGTNPADVLEVKENLAAIRELPEAQRNALGGRLLGYSPGEIAESQGRTESSVHGLVHRGRRRAQEIIDPQHEP